MANARAQARAVGGAAAYPGAEGSGGGFWKWAALSGLGLLVAGGLAFAVAAPKAEPYNPQQWAVPTATPEVTLEAVMVQVVADRAPNQIFFSSIETRIGQGKGAFFIEHNPKKSSEEYAKIVLDNYTSDIIPAVENRVGVSAFSYQRLPDGRIFAGMFIDSDGPLSGGEFIVTDATLRTYVHELVHTAYRFSVGKSSSDAMGDKVDEGIVDYITQYVLADLAEKNSSTFQALKEFKFRNLPKGSFLNYYTPKEVDLMYGLKEGYGRKWAVKGDKKTYGLNPDGKTAWTFDENGRRIDLPRLPDDAVRLSDIPVAELGEYRRLGDPAMNLVTIAFIDLDHLIGQEPVWLGINGLAEYDSTPPRMPGTNLISLERFYQTMLKHVPNDKLAVFDKWAEERFFGPELFKSVKASLPASQQVSANQLRAAATVSAALPSQYSKLTLPSEQRALEAKLGR